MSLSQRTAKISNLAWYNKKDGFVSDENFKLHPLTIEKDETPSLKVRRWLAFPSNATLTRGVLIARLTANDRTFYLFEIQRKRFIAIPPLKKNKFQDY